MDWIDEADGVFRGGGVKGHRARGRAVRVRRAPGQARAPLGQRRGRERRRDHRLLPRGRPRAPPRWRSCCRPARRSPASRTSRTARQGARRPVAAARAGARRGRRVRDVVRRRARGHDVRAGGQGRENGSGRDWRLKLIAVDVTNKDLLVLPDDLADYRLPGEGDADRPGRLQDRARRAHEHVDPVLLPSRSSSTSQGHRATRLIVDGGTLDVELPGVAVRQSTASDRSGRASAVISAAARSASRGSSTGGKGFGGRRSASRSGGKRRRRRSLECMGASTSSTPRRRRGTSASCRTRPACARSRSTRATSARPIRPPAGQAGDADRATAARPRASSSTRSASTTT